MNANLFNTPASKPTHIFCKNQIERYLNQLSVIFDRFWNSAIPEFDTRKCIIWQKWPLTEVIRTSILRCLCKFPLHIAQCIVTYCPIVSTFHASPPISICIISHEIAVLKGLCPGFFVFKELKSGKIEAGGTNSDGWNAYSFFPLAYRP